MSEMDRFFSRANALLDRLEPLLARGRRTRARFEDGEADCWQYNGESDTLEAVHHIAGSRLDDLRCVDRQKQQLVANTTQFIRGLPANNALLWGPRGTGKSSLIKSVFNHFRDQGLKLVEVQRDDLRRLSAICETLYDRDERFIIYCDDLSFEAEDPSYKAVKVILDGSIRQTPGNVLVYATSNRRHLVPERMSENLESGMVDGDLHMSETVEEKLSLSERFGLWIAFHPFNQDQYLEIVGHWLRELTGGELDDGARREALKWALQHASRSGRSASLFARDWAGKRGLASS